MIYSCCKQTADGRATAVQRLDRGSVICFGSEIDGAFCLDTVFVIASAEPWAAAGAVEMDLGLQTPTCEGDAVLWSLSRGR
jgi:hypothetical protein